MARKRPPNTESRIAKLIAEGRGQGEGELYFPWIPVARYELSSTGRSRKLKGIKIRRIHHLLSDLEYYLFLILEFSLLVLDIREQYPLFPRKFVLELAKALGIRHPVDPKTKVPYVLTSDFVVTLNIPEIPYAVISAKYASAFEKGSRVNELLELERRVWAARGVPFWLFTDEDIPRQLVKNLDWLRQGARLPARLTSTIPHFLEFVAKGEVSGGLLRDFAEASSRALKITQQDSYHLFKHCAWTHRLSVDLNKPILPIEPIGTISLGPTPTVPGATKEVA